jgi:hypothetical protein
MLGTREDEVPDTELPNPAQSLDFGSVDQIQDLRTRYGYEPVNGIRKNLVP